MALFKIFKGNSSTLPGTYKDGYCYFTVDDGKMYIDTKDSDSTGRILLNAGHADTATSATKATKLATARTIQINLASTSTSSFDGSANITPGVTGVLPIKNGGTGASTALTGYRNLVWRGTPTSLDSAASIGSYKISPNVTNTPQEGGMWGACVLLTDDAETIGNTSGSVWQTLYQTASTNVWLRCRTNGTSWTGWHKILTSNNYNQYALPLTGGKLTGALNIGNNLELWTDSEGGNIRFTSPQGNRWSIDAAGNTDLRFIWEENTVPFHFYNDGSISASGTLAVGGDVVFNSIGDSGTSHGLIWNGSSDGANIYYRTDGSDKGRLVFNLRDDDNTYICFAKNGADFANIDTAGYFSGSAYAAHLLKPTHNASTTSTWASDWTANVADHSGVKVWGQAFANSTLPNDSGDIVLWLNGNTQLNISIDGHFYQNHNKLVLDDNNYRNYALPLSGGTMYGTLRFADNVGITGSMGGGTDYWTLCGYGENDQGCCILTINDNSDDWFGINFYDCSDGVTRTSFRAERFRTLSYRNHLVWGDDDSSTSLQVAKPSNNGVVLRADNEGGNINIYSGNGHTNFWEIDSYNGDLRIYTWRESDGNYSGAVRIGQESGCLYGAVWNDYAEYRNQEEEIEPGYIVISSKNGKIRKTSQRLSPFDGVVSDTFGFAIGETDECKTPLAVAGRVLVYCEGDRNLYEIGDVVCASENGKACKMTREEIREWPDRIVGTVSEIPEYETWGQSSVEVNERIWIKVK